MSDYGGAELSLVGWLLGWLKGWLPGVVRLRARLGSIRLGPAWLVPLGSTRLGLSGPGLARPARLGSSPELRLGLGLGLWLGYSHLG